MYCIPLLWLLQQDSHSQNLFLVVRAGSDWRLQQTSTVRRRRREGAMQGKAEQLRDGHARIGTYKEVETTVE